MSENIQNIQLQSIEKKLNISFISISIVLLIIGVVLFLLSNNLDNQMLSSAIIFAGVILVLIAAFLLFTKNKQNVYSKTGSPVTNDSHFFDTSDFYGLKVALENNDFNAIKKFKKIEEGNIQIYTIHSKDNMFAAAQLFKYEPFDFIPQTEIIIMENEQASNFIKSINL